MIKRVKIYGERNTNTNYVSKLIKLNLDVEEVSGVAPPFILNLQDKLPGKELVRDIYFQLTFKHNLGWKHTCVRPSDQLNMYDAVNESMTFLTITKNPYSWLMSLYRNPYHQYYTHKPDFETFLQQPWKTVFRDNCSRKLKSPIHLWNIKNKSYLQLDRRNTLSVTTESIFEDPAKIIGQLSQNFSINKKTDQFTNYERSTKDKTKDSNYYRDYYLQEKWRENLSNKAIEIINRSVDREVMEFFGYQLINP